MSESTVKENEYTESEGEQSPRDINVVTRGGKKLYYYSQDIQFVDSKKNEVYKDVTEFEENFIKKLNRVHGTEAYDFKFGDKYINVNCMKKSSAGSCKFKLWYTFKSVTNKISAI
jgi:hypothetical protein